MVKKHLKDVVRKFNIEDKENYDYVLTQNERNLELPDTLMSKFLNSLKFTDFSFYPSLEPLKIKIRNYSNCDNIFLTPGSDVGIKTIFELYELENKEILTSEYFFPMYQVYADIHNAKLVKTKYRSRWFYIQDLIQDITENTKLIILANPNSPMGDIYTLQDIELLLDKGIPTIIDEAYIELSNAQSAISLIKKYPNLYVTRTFSKGFGAAGCRVGYICTNKDNLALLEKLRLMYEISGVSAKYCEFILDNLNYFKTYMSTLLEEKEKFVKYLEKQKFFPIFNTPSSWFFLYKTKKTEEFIKQHNINVREVSLDALGDNTWYKFNYDLKLKNIVQEDS